MGPPRRRPLPGSPVSVFRVCLAGRHLLSVLRTRAPRGSWWLLPLFPLRMDLFSHLRSLKRNKRIGGRRAKHKPRGLPRPHIPGCTLRGREAREGLAQGRSPSPSSRSRSCSVQRCRGTTITMSVSRDLCISPRSVGRPVSWQRCGCAGIVRIVPVLGPSLDHEGRQCHWGPSLCGYQQKPGETFHRV